VPRSPEKEEERRGERKKEKRLVCLVYGSDIIKEMEYSKSVAAFLNYNFQFSFSQSLI
jgi:hypothetical protein